MPGTALRGDGCGHSPRSRERSDLAGWAPRQPRGEELPGGAVGLSLSAGTDTGSAAGGCLGPLGGCRGSAGVWGRDAPGEALGHPPEGAEPRGLGGRWVSQ